MNVYNMLRHLKALKAQWERDAKSPDLKGRVGIEWIKGVIYGITITINELETFLYK